MKHEPDYKLNDGPEDDVQVNKSEHDTDDEDDDDDDVRGKIYSQVKTIKTEPDDCDDREEEKCRRKKGRKLPK